MGRPSYGKYQKIKNVKELFLMNSQECICWYTRYYLRTIIFFDKILRSLLRNKKWNFALLKSQQFNSYKTARDFTK